MNNLLILLNATAYDTFSDYYPRLDWEFFIVPVLILLILVVATFFALRLVWRLVRNGVSYYFK